MTDSRVNVVLAIMALVVLGVIVLVAHQAGMFVFGASVITLTPVQVQSSAPGYWNDLTWQGNAVFNGGGQSVFGSTTQVNTLVQPPYTSTNTLLINFSMTSEKLVYSLTDRQKPLYTSSFFSDGSKSVTYTCAIGRSHKASDCVSGQQFAWEICGNLNDPAVASQYTQGCKNIGGIPAVCNSADLQSRTCLFATVSKVADVYTLQPPSKPFSSQITLTSGGKTESIIISDTSPSATSTNIAGSLVGQLVGSGQNPPSEGTAIAVNKATGGFALVPYFSTPSVMATSAAYWQQDSSPYGSYAAKDIQTLASERDQMNAQINGILSSPTPYGWANSQTPVSITSTAVTLDATNQPYYYPQVNFFVKAAWLGIFIPASKPVMVSVNVPQTLKAGVLGTATATIRNDGTMASIDVSLTCTNGVTVVSGNPFRVSSLGTGQTGIATWQISENIAQGTTNTYTCTAIATDANDPRIASLPMSASGTEQGQPAPVCGNAICEPPTETQSTCSKDCGTGMVYCTDGTQSGQCSYQKPLFCNNGQFQYKSGTCGCPSGLNANADGTCGAGTPTCPTGQKLCSDNTCKADCGGVIPPQPVDYMPYIAAGAGVLLLAGVYIFTRAKRK